METHFLIFQEKGYLHIGNEGVGQVNLLAHKKAKKARAKAAQKIMWFELVLSLGGRLVMDGSENLSSNQETVMPFGGVWVFHSHRDLLQPVHFSGTKGEVNLTVEALNCVIRNCFG